MKNMLNRLMISLLVSIVVGSCSKNNYIKFEHCFSHIYFVIDTNNDLIPVIPFYGFPINAINLTNDTIELDWNTTNDLTNNQLYLTKNSDTIKLYDDLHLKNKFTIYPKDTIPMLLVPKSIPLNFPYISNLEIINEIWKTINYDEIEFYYKVKINSREETLTLLNSVTKVNNLQAYIYCNNCENVIIDNFPINDFEFMGFLNKNNF